MAGHTGGQLEGPAARGRRRRWRAGAGDLGRPEMGKTAWAAMQGSRRCVAPWRGRGRRGKAFGHSGGVERRWWLRLRRAAATAVLGHASERAREERRRNGGSESGPGGAWHPQGDGETGREAGGGLGVCPRAPATRLRLLARGGRRQGGGEVEMGWAVLLGQVGYQVSAR